MKADELRQLTPEDLETRLEEIKEEYFNLRFSNATGQLENYKRLGQVKKDIARLETIAKERALGIEVEVAPQPTKSRRKPKTEEPTATQETAETQDTAEEDAIVKEESE